MPTYNEIYYATYVETPNKSLGVTPAQFRISFLLPSYSGQSTLLEVYDKAPCKISKASASSDRFDVIQSLKATFSLRTHSVEHAESFYVTSDRAMQVIVTVDWNGGANYANTVFAGWVLPTDLSFDYKKPPFALDVTAICGLASLKDRPLLDREGKRLKGLVSLSEVLRTALERTDMRMEMEAGINLFELSDVAVGQTINGKVNPAKDPLYQTLVHAEAFVTDKSEALSCYDSIEKVLKPFNGRLAQVNGAWLVLRNDECAGGWDVWNGSGSTIHTRRYTLPNTSDIASSHRSIDLNLYAYPKTALQVLKQSPKVGSRIIKAGVRVEQAFGGYLDKLPNANGFFAQVDNTGLPVGWARKNSDANRVKRVGTGTEADPYRVRINGIGYDGYIEDQSQGIYEQLHTDTGSLAIDRNKKITRTLKFRFRLYNAKGAVVVIRASTEAGHWWILAEGGTWVRDPKSKDRKGIVFYNFVLANNVETPKPGWSKVELTIPPVDYNPTQGVGINEFNIFFSKPYALEVHNADGKILGPVTTPEGYIEIADVELVEEDLSIKLDGTQRTIVQVGKSAETVSSLTLGDIPSVAKPNDRLNVLFYRNPLVVAANFYRPDSAIGSAGQNAGLGKSLIDWVTESRARQLMLPAASFEADLIGRMPFGPMSVIHIGDVGQVNQDDLFITKAHQFVRYEWDTRGCKVTSTLVEMNDKKDIPAQNITRLGEWQSGSDTIPIENDLTSGEPVAPTPMPTLPPDVSIKKVLGALGLLPGLGLDTNAPALYVPADPTDPQFTATGRVNGIVVGRTVSALRRTTLFQIPP